MRRRAATAVAVLAAAIVLDAADTHSDGADTIGYATTHVWTTRVADGAFDSIKNRPVQQEVLFARTQARYFRFTALRDVARSGWASIAEVTVLPAAHPAEPDRRGDPQ